MTKTIDAKPKSDQEEFFTQFDSLPKTIEQVKTE